MTPAECELEFAARLRQALEDHVPKPDATATLIVGGGIGGLATALALARRGIACHVLERRLDFSEHGAGIQIGPNGVHVLRALGVAETLQPKAGVPEALVVHAALSGRELTRLPLGGAMAAKFGAPYWVVHREDLHAALLHHASGDAAITLTRGADVIHVASGADAGGVITADGRCFMAPVVVGADGLHSRLASSVAPGRVLQRTGKAAFRGVAAAAAVPAALNDGAVHIWLRPDAHVVHYPVRGGSEVAMVVIADKEFAGDGWDHAADIRPVAESLRLSSSLHQLLEAGQGWRQWALQAHAGGVRLVDGRVALVGDAAHPVLPFLAQGGVLALEDAVVLAHVLELKADLSSALRVYDRQRRARVERVAAASRRNGRIYHLAGAAAAARNAVLRFVPGDRLMTAYDWIYGWRSP